MSRETGVAMTRKPKALDGQLRKILNNIEHAVRDGNDDEVRRRWGNVKNKYFKEMIAPHLSDQAKETLGLEL